MTGYIGECGHPVSERGIKLCRLCWLQRARREPTHCLDCGCVISSPDVRHCIRCAAIRRRANFCAGCGRPVSRGTTRYCMACFHKSLIRLHTCKDCGKQFRSREAGAGNPTWERCRPCYDTRHRNRPKRPCSIPGCPYPHRAKGYCWNHYKRYCVPKKPRGKGIGAGSRRWVAQQPCAVCAYSRLKSHVHKVDASLGYTEGNRVPLCARCHEEIHRGITTLPDIRL